MVNKRGRKRNRVSRCGAVILCALSGAAACAQVVVPAQSVADSFEPFPGPIRLLLPPRIYAVPGIEMNVYFDNVCLVVNPANYVFDVTCAKGKQQVERWTFVATDQDAGEYPFVLEVRNETNGIIARAESVLQVVPKDVGTGVPLKVLVIGDSLSKRDSLTYVGNYPDQLLELCNADSNSNPCITLLGHVPKGHKSPREGYGGWTARRFMTKFKEGKRSGESLDWKAWNACGSPFLCADGPGKFKPNFAPFCREFNGGKGPDVVTIFLGVNDNFGSNDDTIEKSINTMFKYEDMMIDMIRKVRKDTKIAMFLTVPPAATQDAFCGNQTRWQYKRNQQRVVERMIGKYGNREAEHIYLVPSNVNLDTMHNYPVLNGPLNSRTKVEGARLSNGVHPSGEGQSQIGDSIYCWLKAQLAPVMPSGGGGQNRKGK